MSKYKFVEGRGKVVLPGLMASANAYLERIRFVEIINEKVKWDPLQWHLSPGILLKAMVLNTFTSTRTPLYRIAESYKGIDTERLFGQGVTEDQLTDSALGAALERVYAANAESLLQTIILTVFKKYEIPIQRFHSDTTSLSFYGSYENTQTDEVMTAL